MNITDEPHAGMVREVYNDPCLTELKDAMPHITQDDWVAGYNNFWESYDRDPAFDVPLQDPNMVKAMASKVVKAYLKDKARGLSRLPINRFD